MMGPWLARDMRDHFPKTSSMDIRHEAAEGEGDREGLCGRKAENEGSPGVFRGTLASPFKILER